MTGRPVDWAPLASGDPVAGEPAEVSAASAHYRRVAAEIASQVARLKVIGAGEQLLGRAATELRGAAAELADRLQRTHTGYAEVSGALSSWEPRLETAQRDSLTALRSAQEAQRRLDAVGAPVERPRDPRTPEQAVAEEVAERRRVAELEAAADDLGAARALLRRVLEERDRQAERVAGAIRAAMDESVKDSWWDGVKEWAHRHADMLKKVAEVLSLAATALAAVALFIPGINILVIVGLTLGGLALRSLLAASGEGSWTDVAMDVFSLATLGTGRLLTQSALAARSAALARASSLEAASARGAARGSRLPDRVRLRDTAAARTAAGRRAKIELQAFDQESVRLYDTGATRGRARVLVRPLPPVTVVDRLRAGGDDTLAALVEDRLLLKSRYAGDPTFDAMATLWGVQTYSGIAVVGSSAVVDAADKAIGQPDPQPSEPSLTSSLRHRDRFRAQVGSTW